MLRRLLVAGLAIAVVGTISVAEAQRRSSKGPSGKWVQIGEATVDLGNDSVVIDVSQAKGAFRAVRLDNKRGRLEISGLEIRYAGGKVHEDRRTHRLTPGRTTPTLDLRSEDRFVDRVTIAYRRQKGAQQTGLVRVMGLQSASGAQASREPASGPVTAGPTAPGAAPKAPATPVAGGEVLFGVQRVGFSVDRDAIQVGQDIGKFDRIRLRVLDHNIFIGELRVVYLTGEPDVLAVSAEVKKDSWTRWFNVKGDRFIKEVQLIYRARQDTQTGTKGKSKDKGKTEARVEVYGEYADSWIGAQGEAVNFNKGWVYLGGRHALFFSIRSGLGYEKETIPVGRNRGGFLNLRVDVKDRAITLNEMRIVYEDGTADTISVKNKVDAGASFGPVKIKPEPIKEIQVSYRSRILDGGKGYAFVQFWAQH